LSNKSRLPVEIQRTYYTQTADRYDSMHACEGATDQEVLRLVQGFIRMLQIGSLLDVGTATGLGMRPLKEAIPELFVCGVEPVSALIDQGIRQGAASTISFVRASGDTLPFPDASFDAVCEFAVLHHAQNPSAVVKKCFAWPGERFSFATAIALVRVRGSRALLN
jgi:ubiquinone/menaquinone biosynthesis C-methylase UbiE